MAIGRAVPVGINRATCVERIWALVVVGGFAAVISSYMWLPFLTLSPWLNATPYLQPEKYDSYGAGPDPVRGWEPGDLFDYGRLPFLTVLFAVGVGVAIIGRSRPALVVLGVFRVWLVAYFGRPTLGPIVDLLPMHDGLLLHRFIGAVTLAAILLMGIGGAVIWQRLRRTGAGP